MLSKKARNLIRRAKREYTHRLLDLKLPSRVLWRSLDKMGTRDSGESIVIFSSGELSYYYSSLGEDDAPMDRSQGASPAIPADCGYDGLFYFSNVTDMLLMQSVELNLWRWGWTEFRLGSFGLYYRRSCRACHTFNFSRCLEDVQDSACPKDT
jgi:hypothetical protein